MAGCSADHRLRAGSRAGLVGVGVPLTRDPRSETRA